MNPVVWGHCSTEGSNQEGCRMYNWSERKVLLSDMPVCDKLFTGGTKVTKVSCITQNVNKTMKVCDIKVENMMRTDSVVLVDALKSTNVDTLRPAARQQPVSFE